MSVGLKLGSWPHNEVSGSGRIILLRRTANYIYNLLATEYLSFGHGHQLHSDRAGKLSYWFEGAMYSQVET